MGIVDKLKKKKKSGSVFDAILKKKKTEKEKKEGVPEKPPDMEVTQINAEKSYAAPVEKEVEEKRLVTEFRTEGLHEFDIDSLGAVSGSNIKIEYKSKITQLIDADKIDEAIRLLLELKDKLANRDK